MAIDTSKLSPAGQKTLAKLQAKTGAYKKLNADQSGIPSRVDLPDAELETSFACQAYLERTYPTLTASPRKLVGMNIWQLVGTAPVPHSATGMTGGIVVVNAVNVPADWVPSDEDLEQGKILAEAYRQMIAEEE